MQLMNIPSIIKFYVFLFIYLCGIGFYDQWYCSPCDKQFRTKSTYKRHRLNNCPFSFEKAPLLLCTEIDCNYTSRRPDNLKKHIERHKYKELENYEYT